MNRNFRLATLVAGALVGLAFAGSALASYTPRLAVSHKVVAKAGPHPTTIHVSVPQSDDPTAALQIFAPAGYTFTAPAPGTTLGAASGAVYARDTGLTLPLAGTVTAADPAQYTGPPNNQCSPGTHFAVWLLSLSVAGQTIAIPIYVDPTSGNDTVLGAYKIRACFTAPDTPPGSANHAPLGAQLLDANFTIDSAISLPSASGRYAWRALFTPYTPGAGVPNAAGTVEARSFLGLPGTISLGAKYLAKTNTYKLTGAVRSGPTVVQNATVAIYRGRTTKVAKVSSTKTNARGTFSTAGHLSPRKTTYFQARVTVAEQDYAEGCTANVQTYPVPCASATLGGFSAVSQLIRIKL
jgi:hypothetical protein